MRGPRQKGAQGRGLTPSAPGEDTRPERRGSGLVLEAPALGRRVARLLPADSGLVRKPSDGATWAVNPPKANIPETRCETGMNPDPTTASQEAKTGHAQTHVHSRSTHACTFLGGSVSVPRPALPTQAPRGGCHTEPHPPGHRRVWGSSWTHKTRTGMSPGRHASPAKATWAPPGSPGDL